MNRDELIEKVAEMVKVAIREDKSIQPMLSPYRKEYHQNDPIVVDEMWRAFGILDNKNQMRPLPDDGAYTRLPEMFYGTAQ